MAADAVASFGMIAVSIASVNPALIFVPPYALDGLSSSVLNAESYGASSDSNARGARRPPASDAKNRSASRRSRRLTNPNEDDPPEATRRGMLGPDTVGR